MGAIIYIVETLLSLALLVMLSRLLLQLSRADFRNPLCQAVVKLTNWLILPLRRVLPPIGRIDTASVLAVLIMAIVDVGGLFLLHGVGLPPPELWVRPVLIEIVHMLLFVYLYAIILYTILSLIAPGGYSPAQSVLASLCEPLLRPIRRVVPTVGGLDLSPLVATIVILALLHLPYF
jgi:YggT family protein